MILDSISFPDKPVVSWQRCSCDLCVYCDSVVYRNYHEHDHFPVRKESGGSKVVPACPSCHKLKDTVSLNHWNFGDFSGAVHELRELGILSNLSEVPDCWFDMTSTARLLWGKLSWMQSFTVKREQLTVEDEIQLIAIKYEVEL